MKLPEWLHEIAELNAFLMEFKKWQQKERTIEEFVEMRLLQTECDLRKFNERSARANADYWRGEFEAERKRREDNEREALAWRMRAQANS